MREVEVDRRRHVIEKLCIEANEHLPKDVKDAITTCRACEDGEIAKGVLDDIIKNFDIADQECVPKSPPGYRNGLVFYPEIGQDVHFVGATPHRCHQRGRTPRIYKRLPSQICRRGPRFAVETPAITHRP